MIYIPDEKALQEREKEKANADKFIEFISEQRKQQIGLYGAAGAQRHSDLENKYGKYLFVPLALPIFEVPDKEHFFAWWSSHMAITKKLGGDAVMSGYGITPFETIDIVNEIGNQWWEANNQRESFKSEFPKLWQQFNDYLPFDKLLRLTFWSSRHAIQEHRDSAEFMDAPGSLRVMLYDNNPEETLYVFDNPLSPFESGEPHMLPRAPGTNSFVWNNLRVKHGSIYNPGHKKVLAFAAGLFNIDKYEELMENSLNLYKDYCITSKYSIEQYVNL